MLIDLACTVRPAFTLVDAVLAMEGDGPSGGTPRKTGFLAGSTDPFALDVFLCGQIGLSPGSVDTIRLAAARGLCSEEVDFVRVGGEPVRPVADFKKPRSKGVDFSNSVPAFLKRPVDAVVNRFFVARPVIDRGHCVGCGKCAESCPPQTIAMVGGKAVIDYQRCVKCFCCHEMCPVRAIGIKRGR
jgi:Pyruvate/2-oxoacid:ferredoxin oxidoreductase delta subunit